MTFIEATSSGKDFRRVGDDKSEFFWYGDDDDKGLMERVGNTTHEPKLTWRDYFRGEFEFVEPETIEVGDNVKLNRDGFQGGHGYKVIWRRDKSKSVMIQYKDDLPFRVEVDELTLIRKGPKVHVFEGMGIVVGNQLFGKDLGSIVDHTGIFGLSNNGKTYRMELTKEVSE